MARSTCATPAAAAQSPLAERLFGIDGVTGVFFGADFISVTKDARRMAAAQARDPRRHHGALHVAARRFCAATSARPTRRASDEFFEQKDADTVATIKELIETRVRPAVANDGGDITFRGFKDGVVYLDMKGACAGCPSSTATLRTASRTCCGISCPTWSKCGRCPDAARTAASDDQTT